MKKIELLEDGKIRKWKTPSKWNGNVACMPVMELKLSCGGGIGGALWYEYVVPMEMIPSNQIIKVTRFDGSKFYLNSSFLVQAETYTLTEAELDITEWASTSKHYNDDLIEKKLFLIKDGMEAKLSEW